MVETFGSLVLDAPCGLLGFACVVVLQIRSAKHEIAVAVTAPGMVKTCGSLVLV
jgi:hypothetical protein